MSSEDEAARELPSSFDLQGLNSAFSNPTEAFRMLDQNGDGKVTTKDLEMILEKFGIKGISGKVVAKFIFKQLDADHSGTIEPKDLVHANGILSKLLKTKGQQ